MGVVFYLLIAGALEGAWRPAAKLGCGRARGWQRAVTVRGGPALPAAHLLLQKARAPAGSAASIWANCRAGQAGESNRSSAPLCSGARRGPFGDTSPSGAARRETARRVMGGWRLEGALSALGAPKTATGAQRTTAGRAKTMAARTCRVRGPLAGANSPPFGAPFAQR